MMNEIKGYIEGKIPCPDEALDPEGAKSWECNNMFVKRLINENLAETKHSHTQGCVTAVASEARTIAYVTHYATPEC